MYLKMSLLIPLLIPLFILFLIPVFAYSQTVNEAHAAYYTIDVVMEKNNGDLILISKDTAQKLIERGYAKETIDFAKVCNTRVIDYKSESVDCFFNDNNLDEHFCILIKNTTEPCIWEFDKPETLKECEKLYKIFSVYNIGTELEEESEIYHIISTLYFFSHYCGMSLPDIVEWESDPPISEKIREHYAFIFHDGIPQTMNYLISGGDQTIPTQYYGGGNVKNTTHFIEFEFRTWQHLVMEFDIQKITKLS